MGPFLQVADGPFTLPNAPPIDRPFWRAAGGGEKAVSSPPYDFTHLGMASPYAGRVSAFRPDGPHGMSVGEGVGGSRNTSVGGDNIQPNTRAWPFSAVNYIAQLYGRPVVYLFSRSK